MKLAKILTRPFSNKLGIGGDNDEGTLAMTAVNWAVVVAVLILITGVVGLFYNGARTMVKYNNTSIQNQNESVTK